MPTTIEDPTLTWRVAVIDLSQAVGITVGAGTFTENGDSEYCAKFVQIIPFRTASAHNAEDFMDISYMAFCSSLEDALAVVDTTTYDYYTTTLSPTVIAVQE